MALKYERGESTGIYTTGRWHATDVVSMYKVVVEMNRSMDIDFRLGEVERKARRIVRSHGVKIRRKSGLPAQLPKSAPGILRDAEDVLHRAYFVRLAIAKNDARNASLNGLLLGSALERMGVRPFEPYVKTGKKIKRSARLGGLMRKPPEGRSATWQTAINELAARRRDLPFRALARIVGKQFNRSERTIRKHTKNPHEK